MSAKKNTRPDVGASERAKEPGRASRQGHVSTHNNTTSPPPGQRISDYLLRGEAHAIPLRHLRELLHLPNRTIRLMIRQERFSGVPILESSRADGGYFLPDSPDERDLCVKRLRHRAAQIVAVADAVAEAIIEKGEDGIA